MLAGLLVATLQFILYQNKESFIPNSFLSELAEIPAIYLFPFIFFFSLAGSFLGTFLTPMTDAETLKKFYTTVKPWGWWKTVFKMLKNEDIPISQNTNFTRDMSNCFIGIIWQSSMILMPIYFVIRDYELAFISLLIFCITSLILKFTWLDKIKNINSENEENYTLARKNREVQ